MSLLNGLSAAGQSIATFAGTAGLDAQKADLTQQQLQLADQLATTRESAGRQEAGKIAQASQDRAQTFTAGENAQNRAADAAKAKASEDAAMARTQATINAPPPEIKLLRALGALPDPATPAATTVPSDGGASQAPAPSTTKTTPDLSNPLVAKTLGVPPPGSDGAIRLAIADGVTRDPAFKDRPPNEQAAEIKKRLASASASLSSDSLDTIADRTIAGDTSALTGLGYGEGGAANRAAVQERITEKLKAQGMTGADLAAAIAGYAGEKAGARSAGTREANVGMAVTEAQLFMPLALSASKLVPRTQFPTLNSILESAEKGVGGENVVRLAVATNSLVNAYSRAITPSGVPTEGNQARARELLDKAWSDGQFGAAIDQLSKEMSAAKQSPVVQQQEQRDRISGRSAPAAVTAPASPAVTTPVGAIPSWVKPGDQYSPSRGQARGADGTVYGPP